MHGNQFTFSRSGGRQKLYRVITFPLPGLHILNGYFLPDATSSGALAHGERQRRHRHADAGV